MIPLTSTIMLPTELATAEQLIEFSNDPERFSYEYLIMYKLVDEKQVLDLGLMKIAMRYIIVRHPNFLAYYEKNLDGVIERKYHKNQGKVFIQFDFIKQKQIKAYIKERRKLETFVSTPNQRYYFAKTEKNYYIMSYNHHSFKDVLIDQTILEELMSVYYVLVKNPQADYEKATGHLAKIASYDEVLLDFYKVNQEKLKKIIVFLRPRFQNVSIPQDSLLNQNTTLCKANKLRYVFPDSPAIIKKIYKQNICLMTLALMSLQSIFKIPGTLPIWKLNGSRPKIADGVLCSYIKDQVFAHPLNPKNTFHMQYQQNYCHNKQSLILFNECDYAQALQTLSQQLQKDCNPKVCFNFYKANQFSKNVYICKQMSDQYDVVNSIMNIYFDMMYDNRINQYSITVFYKKNIFDDEVMKDVMEFIDLGYRYLERIGDVRVEEISLEFLRGLEKVAIRKLEIAKPKL